MSQVSTAAPEDLSMAEGTTEEGATGGLIGGIPGPFLPRPFATYTGHTSDLLDVSWSKVGITNLHTH